jgi:hypothetical protein
VEVGERLILQVAVTGQVPGDEAPFGNASLTVDGPGSFTDVNTLYGLNPENPGSEDCSELHAYDGSANGQCELTFSEAGVYTISTAYTSDDENYFDRSGPGATVDAG